MIHPAVTFRAALISFLLATALASFWIVPQAVPWLCVAVGALCLMLSRPRYIMIGVMLFTVALGVWRYQAVRTNNTELHQLARAKADVVVTGYIDSDAKKGQRDWSMHVMATEVNGQPIKERLLIRTAQDLEKTYGDGVRLTGRIGLPSAFDDFDYPAYLRAHGIRAIMIHPQVESISLKKSVWVGGARAILNIRDRFMASIRRSVPEPAASYLIGILVGGRAALPQNIVDAFSRTSTSHVLAISGYNITILSTAIMAGLVSRIGRRRAMLGTALFIVVFVIMTGAGASIVRAALMSLLMLVASALGRQADIKNIILLSAVAMVAYNPLILRDDVGFQLSFAALSGLVWLEPLIKLPKLLAATLAAQIAVLPLILYYFHTLSVIGPLANVLILPVVPLAMALGFATGVIGLLVPIIAKVVGVSAWIVASYNLNVVQYLAALPWSAFELHINTQILIALYGIIAIWWHLEKKRSLTYHKVL